MGSELAHVHSVSEIQSIAEASARSGLFPGVQNPQQAFVLMMLCQSEGLHPMQALKRYHIINGRPAMRADAMQAEFQRQGGRIHWLETTAERCTARFYHPTHTSEEGVDVTVTIQEMQAAGVLGNPTWKKFPANMLRARVISNGVRMVLPGVVTGIYSEAEAEVMEPPPTPQQPAQARVVEARVAQAPPAKGDVVIDAAHVVEGADDPRSWVEVVRDLCDQNSKAIAAEFGVEAEDYVNRYEVNRSVWKLAINAKYLAFKDGLGDPQIAGQMSRIYRDPKIRQWLRTELAATVRMKADAARAKIQEQLDLESREDIGDAIEPEDATVEVEAEV